MKANVVQDKTHPYVLLQDVFPQDDFNRILKYTETFDHGERFLDEQSEFWDILNNKAWEIYDLIFDELLGITSQPINKFISDVNRTRHFKIQLTVLPSGFLRNKIHRDSDWKQMAIVVYMSDQGDGTMLYRTDDPSTHYHTVPFEPNTAFCHIPSETSWHDFSHPEKYEKDRITLMFLLVDEEDYNK